MFTYIIIYLYNIFQPQKCHDPLAPQPKRPIDRPLDLRSHLSHGFDPVLRSILEAVQDGWGGVAVM